MNTLRTAISAGIAYSINEAITMGDVKQKAKDAGTHLKKNWKKYATGVGALAVGKVSHDMGVKKGYDKGYDKGQIDTMAKHMPSKFLAGYANDTGRNRS